MTTRDVSADLSKLLMGFRVSQAIHVAAVLGLADLLASGGRASDELAAATKTHPLALYRLMRALASAGIFRERDHRSFELTAIGELLRSDVVGTQTPMAQLVGRPSYWQAWGDLLHAVRSGETAFNHVHGADVWEYRASHAQEGEVFDRAMAALTDRFAAAVTEVCDFDRFINVVDIGGGDGTFLAKILTTHPRVHATLLDQPHVIARAAASFESLMLSSRCRAVGGDFFVSVPEGGDVYLMKSILHDWDDVASIEILRACRDAMKPTSRLLVLEHVIGPPNIGPEGMFADLHMLVLTGGRERTPDEFAALFDQSGFRLVSVTPTSTPLSVIEGAPVIPE
jgi:O-methyltransferase domain/Dimerisation domain